MMIKKSFSSKLIDMIVTTFPHNHDRLICHPNASMFPNTTTTLLALLNDRSMLTLGEMRKGPSNTIKVFLLLSCTRQPILLHFLLLTVNGTNYCYEKKYIQQEHLLIVGKYFQIVVFLKIGKSPLETEIIYSICFKVKRAKALEEGYKRTQPKTKNRSHFCRHVKR